MPYMLNLAMLREQYQLLSFQTSGLYDPEFKRFVALLKITQEFIEELCPKLIVYSNASIAVH